MSTERILFSAHDASTLCKRVEALEVSVPSRKERQTWQCEYWQIHAFLEFLKSVDCLLAPAALRKREKPDFQLSLTSGRSNMFQLIFGPQRSERIEVGIECSEVIDQSEAKRMAFWEETQGGTEPILMCKYGYAGDFIEEEFATFISCSVQNKHNRFIKGYQRFSKNLLLLYYNNFRPPMRYDLAMSKTEAKLGSYWTESSFDAVIARVNAEFMIFKSDYSELLTHSNRHS